MDNDRKNFKNPQRGRVYDSKGIAPTIDSCQGGQKEPKILVRATKCLNSKGGRGGIDGLQPSVQDRVYDTGGISTAITSSYMPNIMEKQIVAMRDRNPDNPSDRTAGSPTVLIRQATNDRYIECELGGVADLSYPNSDTRRGRVQSRGNISPTITAQETGICRIESIYRIRKLTPLECWRLMGFSDGDFLAVKLGSRQAAEETLEKYPHLGKRAFTEVQRIEKMSNSQLYKQAGNSIVKDVLMAIFGEMLPDHRRRKGD